MNYPQLPAGDLERNPAPFTNSGDGLAAPFYSRQNSDQEPGGEAASGSLLYYWSILRRRKGALLLASFVGAVAGILITLPQTPVFQARASLEIQAVNENFLNMRDVNPNSDTQSSPEYDLQTQVRILQSQTLIERVIARLKRDTRPIPEQAPGRLAAWRKAFGLAQPKAGDTRERMLSAAAGSLKVRAQTNTRLVETFVDSTDPQLAVDFANVLASEFIDQNLEARWQTNQYTGEWLTRQLRDLKTKLETSEEQLQRYARGSGLLITSEKDNVAEEKLRQLQQELLKATADRVIKQSSYELAASASPDALPETLDNVTLRDYQTKITDLRRQLAELTSTLTSAHPKVLKLQAQVATLETARNRERANTIERIKHEYDAARRRENLLAADYTAQSRAVSEQAGKIAHYNILKREVDTTRQLYDSMFQRVKEAGLVSALRASNIRVIDAAKAPRAPYKPSLQVNAALGLLAGMGFGFVLVIIRERTDRSIQEPGETAMFLNVCELAVIPSIDSDPDRKQRRLLRAANGGSNGASSELSLQQAGKQPRRADPAILLSEHRHSVFADSFRAALTSILFSSQNGDCPRVLVVTSASPGEGKTTVTCNLAIALAEVNREVLLIDGDLRRPRLHDVFGLDNSTGLSDLLGDPHGPPVVSQSTGIRNLFVLPSGSSSHTHLLYSPQLPELIRRAREEVDMVLIDSPPMLQMPDARVLGRCADAVILVVRAEQTTLEAAALARQRFSEDGTKVLGTILNNWNPKHTSTYGYGKYYESYKRYYKKS